MNLQTASSKNLDHFMELFLELKNLCSDSPERLKKIAIEDSEIKDLCAEVSIISYFIDLEEGRSPKLYVIMPNASFRQQWRDYKERYEDVVRSCWLSHILNESMDAGATAKLPKEDRDWDYANENAKEQVKYFQDMVAFLEDYATRERDSSQDDFYQKLEAGIDVWLWLTKNMGFNLQGVIRRRALIPYVIVPDAIQDENRISLLTNLKQAHDAFIYDAPHAALALIRSVTEAVLRNHYRAKGDNLKQLIEHAGDCLPQKIDTSGLHEIRDLANSVLHLKRDRKENTATMGQSQTEKKIVSLLVVLRELIEHAE